MLERDLVLRAKLDNEFCAINHIIHPVHRAVNYIDQKFKDFEAAIPICSICEQRLQSDIWILLYCVKCLNSLWINKQESNRGYLYPEGKHIEWMDSCPHCG